MSYKVFWLYVAATSVLFADGGVLLLHSRSGAFDVSVFGTPAPLRVGVADLSVMIQRQADQEVLLNAVVTLRLSKPGQLEIRVHPTREQAASKYLYASEVRFPAPGKWNLQVICKEQTTSAKVNGVVTVLPQEPALVTYWEYFLFVPIAVLLFVLNQYLKQKRRTTNRPARPSPRSAR